MWGTERSGGCCVQQGRGHGGAGQGQCLKVSEELDLCPELWRSPHCFKQEDGGTGTWSFCCGEHSRGAVDEGLITWELGVGTGGASCREVPWMG